MVFVKVEEHTHLGIIIPNSLSPRKYIDDVVMKANQRVGIVKHCFTEITHQKVKTSYLTMVTSVQEYGVPYWSLYYKKFIDALKNTASTIFNANT